MFRVTLNVLLLDYYITFTLIVYQIYSKVKEGEQFLIIKYINLFKHFKDSENKSLRNQHITKHKHFFKMLTNDKCIYCQ